MTEPHDPNPNRPTRDDATPSGDPTLERELDRLGAHLRERPGLSDRVFRASVDHLPAPAPIRFAPAAPPRRAVPSITRLALAASILLVVGLTLVGTLDPFGVFAPGGPGDGDLADGGGTTTPVAPTPAPDLVATTDPVESAVPATGMPEGVLANVTEVSDAAGDTFLVAMLAGDPEIASRVSDTADDGLAARFAPLLTTGFATFDDVAAEVDGILASSDRR